MIRSADDERIRERPRGDDRTSPLPDHLTHLSLLSGILSPNSERDFIMPCAVKSSFKTGLPISLSRDHSYISFDSINGFHDSDRKSLLSEFELRST